MLLPILSFKLFGVRVVFIILFIVALGLYLYRIPPELSKVPVVNTVFNNICLLKTTEPTRLFSDSHDRFNVSKQEEKAFYKILTQSLQGKEESVYMQLLPKVKKAAPEAYYIIVKHALLEPKTVEASLQAYFHGNTAETIDIVIHEYSHSSRFPCFYAPEQCYLGADNTPEYMRDSHKSHSIPFVFSHFNTNTSVWIDNYSLEYQIDRQQTFFDNNIELSKGSALDTRLDDIYYKGLEGDFEKAITELNSYRKSIIISRQMDCTDVETGKADSLFYASVASRLIYHLASSLEFAHTADPYTWDYLTQDKKIAYLLRWETEATIKEIDRTLYEYEHGKKSQIHDISTPQEIKTNLASSRKTLDKFYRESNIQNIPLTFQNPEEMEAYGLDYKLIPY